MVFEFAIGQKKTRHRSGAPQQTYRYFAGRIIARHMCATGLLS